MAKVDKWNSRYKAKDLTPSMVPDGLEQYLQKLKAGRSLDLACGDGPVALWLAKNSHQVTAVDFAAEGIARLQVFAEKAGVEIDTIVADLETEDVLEELPLFDNIIICRYLPDKWLLQRVSSLLKEGGALLFTTFNRLHHEQSGFSLRFCVEPGQFVDAETGLDTVLYIDGVANNQSMDLYLFCRSAD